MANKIMDSNQLLSLYVSMLASFSQTANHYFKMGMNTILSLEMQLTLTSSIIKTETVIVYSFVRNKNLSPTIIPSFNDAHVFLKRLLNNLPDFSENSSTQGKIKDNTIVLFEKALEFWDELGKSDSEFEIYWELFLEIWHKWEKALKRLLELQNNSIYLPIN